MTSPRTAKSDSPLDTPRNRKLLATIKRDLRRIQRRLEHERLAPASDAAATQADAYPRAS